MLSEEDEKKLIDDVNMARKYLHGISGYVEAATEYMESSFAKVVRNPETETCKEVHRESKTEEKENNSKACVPEDKITRRSWRDLVNKIGSAEAECADHTWGGCWINSCDEEKEITPEQWKLLVGAVNSLLNRIPIKKENNQKVYGESDFKPIEAMWQNYEEKLRNLEAELASKKNLVDLYREVIRRWLLGGRT